MRNLNSELQASTKLISILADSKSQLEKNVLEMDGVFVILNEKLEIIESNAHFDAIHDEDCFRKPFFDSIENEYKDECKLQLEKVIQENITADFEVRLRNNRLYLLKVTQFNVTRKEEGIILKVSGVDITDLRDLESQIVDVLRTINLGVIFIDSENKIMPGYSEFSKVMFEKDELLGVDIHEILFDAYLNKFNDSEKETLISLRQVFGKDEIFFKVISFTLPPKFEIASNIKEEGKRILQITLEPITMDGLVVKYMIIAQDVTDITKTKTVTFAEDLYAVAEGFEKTPQDISDCLRDLDSLAARLPSKIDDNASDETKGVLHSIKGLLGMNGLKFMAKLIHDMETYIKPDNYSKFKDSVDENLGLFNNCHQKVNAVYELVSASDNGGASGKVNEKLTKKISSLPEEVKGNYFLNITHVLKEINFVSPVSVIDTVNTLIDNNGMTFETLAELDINVDEVLIEIESFQALKTSLIHMVNNSFAHGFEPGTEENEIKITGKEENGFYTIVYKDNGGGVNVSKMREKLIESGEDANSVNDLSDQRVAECVFKAGISTKDEVSEIAGRGVGLAGVYVDIKRLGGFLTLDEFQDGCQFTLKVPVSLDREKEELVVAADILNHAFDLVFDQEEEKIKIPKGAYHIKDITMFYQGLKEIKKSFGNNLKVTKMPNNNPENEELKKLNDFFKNNGFTVSMSNENQLTLHLVSLVEGIEEFVLGRSLFSCEDAIQKATKQCADTFGIRLVVNGDRASSNESVVFNYINKNIYPSVLRLIESKLFTQQKGSAQ